MNYKEKITKEINTIENDKFLEFFYNLLLSFKKKWGI